MISLLEGLIGILTEAPVSDEDREDSKKLRQIFQKRSGRSNAKLTADEKSLLDKYGIGMDGLCDSLKESYSKQELISAVQWNYGCSKSEALKMIKEMSEERKQLIVDGWKDQAKKSFLGDSLK